MISGPGTPFGVSAAVVALAIALTLDVLVAEFPERLHPVALFGRLVAVCKRQWKRPRLAGVLVAVSLPLVFAGAFGGVVFLGIHLDPVVGTLLAGIALFSTFSLRMLISVTREVVTATRDNPDAARTKVRSLVGRETETLSPAELRSGAVESLAENLADGLVAPLFGFVLGAQVSLAAGVAAAAWIKAVNTLDSMLGYESEPMGWASARLDDIVMWVPARLSAVLIALAARDPGAVVRARQWSGEPLSPNSGWPMATLAVTLDIQLRKANAYTLNPAQELPSERQAMRGIWTVGQAGVLAGVSAGVVTWITVDGIPWIVGGVPWS